MSYKSTQKHNYNTVKINDEEKLMTMS